MIKKTIFNSHFKTLVMLYFSMFTPKNNVEVVSKTTIFANNDEVQIYFYFLIKSITLNWILLIKNYHIFLILRKMSQTFFRCFSAYSVHFWLLHLKRTGLYCWRQRSLYHFLLNYNSWWAHQRRLQRNVFSILLWQISS